MNGMDKIQARIAEEATAELKKIEADTQQEVEAIKAKAEADAKEIAQDILDKGTQQVAERKERLASSAQMECKKMELAMKQEMITEAFDKALAELCEKSEKEYIDLLVSLAIASVSSGTETMVFNEKDKDSVGKQVVAKVNDAISGGKAPELPSAITDSKAGPFLEKMVKAVSAVLNSGSGSITLSEECRNLTAGFIMVDEDVEINCDFDTLVRLQRNNLELEVAEMLFS